MGGRIESGRGKNQEITQMHSRQHKVQQGFPSGASATDPGKDATGSFPAWIVIVLAAALMMLAGCVDSEEDFKSEHPAPSSSSSGSSSSSADPSGSSLTCLTASDISEFGTFSDPADLGTAPVCFEHTTTFDIYFSVVVPNTGTWFFQLVNMTGDLDIDVFEGTDFSADPICSKDAGGTTDDVCQISVSIAGIAGILVDHFGNTEARFYRLEIVQ